jgi:hypothetical protein
MENVMLNAIGLWYMEYGWIILAILAPPFGYLIAKKWGIIGVLWGASILGVFGVIMMQMSRL